MARPSKYDWVNIRLDIEAGLPHESVHKKYDVPYDAINKHLIRNPLVVSQEANAIIKGFDEVSQQVSQLKDKRPDLTQRTLDIIQDKHPQFKQAMVALSSKIFNRALKITDDASASDLVSLARGMQTVTDTLGISQRHAPRMEVTAQATSSSQTIVNIIEDTHERS